MNRFIDLMAKKAFNFIILEIKKFILLDSSPNLSKDRSINLCEKASSDFESFERFLTISISSHSPQYLEEKKSVLKYI